MTRLSAVLNHPSVPGPDQGALAREQAEILYGELDRLPGPFRLAVVLCYFEGLSLDEAASRLRCPAGTVRSRLARACDKLRRGLVRRGFALSAAGIVSALASQLASASVAPSLCEMTTKAAVRFASGQTVAGTVSASAVALATAVLRSAFVTKVKFVAVAFLALGAALALVGFAGQASERQAGKPDPRETVKTDDAAPKPAPGRMFVVGRVLDPQGIPVPNATAMVCAGSKALGKLPGRSGVNLVPIGDARADGSGRFRLDAPRTSSSWYRNVERRRDCARLRRGLGRTES